MSTTRSTEPLLRIRDLRTRFLTARGVVRAVDGVNLSVRAGETMGVVGESGSGKTVLGRTVMGLLPAATARVSGEVLFDGVDLVTADDRTRRSILGRDLTMVFQDPMTSLNPVVRVGKQVTEGLRLHRGLSRRDSKERAIELLRWVNIPEPERRVRQYPNSFSGGMRQRLMIALAIACGPKLLIADEPTTALDVTVQAQILDLLDLKQRDLGLAMILVTHDIGVVANRSDRVAVMYAGQIVEIGNTADVLTRPRMQYTRALIESTCHVDDERQERLPTIGGRPPSLLDPPPGCRFAPRCAQADDQCRNESPPFADADEDGHRYACWHPVELSPAQGPDTRRSLGAVGA